METSNTGPAAPATAVDPAISTDLTPRLPIAICPYCGQIYTEAMDTGGPGFWALREGHGLSVFSPTGNPRHCNHFIVVQRFLLPENGSAGAEQADAEAPYVMGAALEAPLKTAAVMNSMALLHGDAEGRIERYTLYTLTYYAETPYQVGKTRKIIRSLRPEKDPGLLLVAPRESGEEHEWRDLSLWVARERLSWLERGENGPVRRTGPVVDFPFRSKIPA